MKQDERTPGSGYAEIETEVRKIAMSLPPSDFGSTRAIQAVAQWVSQNFTPNCNAYDSTEALRSALAKLTFAARTSGGTAGRDADLCAACDAAEAVLAGNPAPTEAGWIVGNGAGTEWRYWTGLGPAWTSDREIATRFARREDAEAVHAGDEDAWIVQPYAHAALSSSPPEGLRGWRDIETAPKDGTEILTFSDRMGLGTMVLYWADGYWREKANGLGLKYGPTHWMPLPPAPDAARTALAPVWKRR